MPVSAEALISCALEAVLILLSSSSSSSLLLICSGRKDCGQYYTYYLQPLIKAP
jgi:hypothetical protein